MDSAKVVMSSSELVQAHSLLWNYSVNYMSSMSLKCAIELGIPDAIHNYGDQPIPFSKLVAALPIHPSKTPFLYRIMRVLVHCGLFTIQQVDDQNNAAGGGIEEAFSLTNASRLLLTDCPPFLKMKSFCLFHLLPQAMAPWHHMSKWLQNSDATLFETSDGRTWWDCLEQEPKLSDIYNEAMANNSEITAKIALKECRHVFEGLKSFVDVGGGTGTMARAIANAFPHIKCTVFDRPHVVADLQGSDNLSFIGGDMFTDSIPPADAILLKTVLHDWDDEHSLIILKRCREALLKNGNRGKVIIIDMIIENNEKTDKEVFETQLCNDVIMMAMSGKERSLMEWEELFFAAGFARYEVIRGLGERSIIEVYP